MAVSRYLAPAAFLLAATAVVLAVRPALRSEAPVTPKPASRAAPAVGRPRAASPGKQYYVIQSGDTLSGIAERLGRTVDALLRLNPGVEPTALRPGEQIRIR